MVHHLSLSFRISRHFCIYLHQLIVPIASTGRELNYVWQCLLLVSSIALCRSVTQRSPSPPLRDFSKSGFGHCFLLASTAGVLSVECWLRVPFVTYIRRLTSGG